MAALGSPNVDCRQDGSKLEAGARGGYIFNAGIRGIDQADAILLVGTNPRLESPVLNARIRKRYLHGRCAIASIGAPADLTYPVERLGAGAATLARPRRGQGQLRREAGRPRRTRWSSSVTGALAREDGAAVLAMARSLADGARRLERLCRAAHGGEPRRRPRSRPGAGRGRSRRRRHPGRHAEQGDRSGLPAGGRRDRHVEARQGLRGLSWAITATPARTAPT